MFTKIFRICTLLTVLQLSVVLLAHGENVVHWDALKELDELAEQAEVLCEENDVDKLLLLVAPIKEAATQVATDAVPAGAKDAAQVKLLQSDLKSLSDALPSSKQQNGAELVGILSAFHPIVEKLMEATGMPHVHEHEGHHDDHHDGHHDEHEGEHQHQE